MAKVPKWVKSYPYELDRTALENLAASAQGAFDDPREMNFVLYGFKDQKSLDAACDLIIKKGWHVETGPGSDDPSKLMIISQKWHM